MTSLGVASDSEPAAEIRLERGPHRCSGRVEVFYRHFWGTICDNGWGIEEARVVCQQLGCGAAISAERGAQFGRGDKPIWLDDLRCKGTESVLSQCSASDWGENNCTHGQDAGVVCSDTLRLVGSPNRCSGRVEIRTPSDTEWKTICDHTWDKKDAEVVCKQLGCGKATSAPGGAQFGQGSGSILLDDFHCDGTEDDIAQCKVHAEGNNGCHHGQDAGVVCSDPSTINVAAVRLTGGANSCAGKVEVLYQRQWGTVCSDGWNLQDASVVCKQLGCGTALKAPQGAHFGERPGLIWLSNVTCTGTEKSLQDCKGSLTGEHQCGHSEEANVMCTAYSPSNTSTRFRASSMVFAIVLLVLWVIL
ncbi:hypothetical protein lerEdw1_004205 [Lerista edwardsae]|nr:hypothetical protein lerEdw1_004208 [Lerista edwardsae]KAJ6650734.1 hypothetical protein lerEdw1_004205 [Lerista edwardsae]